MRIRVIRTFVIMTVDNGLESPVRVIKIRACRTVIHNAQDRGSLIKHC